MQNKLDIEDNDDRLLRLQNLLERTNNAAAAQPRTNGPASSSSLFDLGNREIHAVPPPTELLNRVQAFLPQIEAANANLAHQAQLDPASIDIENIDDGQYIEMNLGLGVFDMRQPVTSSSPSARTTPDHQANTSDDAHSDSDSSSSSGTSSSDHHSSTSSPSRPVRPLPRRSKPNIVVLSGSSEPNH